MTTLVHLLIDFENVKPSAAAVARIRGDHFRLWIFRGPHQNKFDADMVEAWQPLGASVKFIQSAKSGKNALDFHIAFCLGAAHRDDLAARRAARYVIVSKDSGFDALFEYALSEGCQVSKAPTLGQALDLATATVRGDSPPASPAPPKPPTAPKVAAKSVRTSTPKAPPAKKTASTASIPKRTALQPDDVSKVVSALIAQTKNRPAKRETLEHHVVHLLGNGVTAAVATSIIDRLVHDRIVTVDGTKLQYHLSKKSS
jgi:hypothetical protein